MNKPSTKYWTAKSCDVGMEFGNPNYIRWADERIAELEKEIINIAELEKELIEKAPKDKFFEIERSHA